MIILGIGCNIGDRLTNLRTSIKHLNEISAITVHQISPIYESDALLPENALEDWDLPFLNLAVGITTTLTPEELIIKTKAIEVKMGRGEHLHWSPRTIDIDILAWHEECHHSSKLDIPHKCLLDRPFALWPMADIVPEWHYCESNHPDTDKQAWELAAKFGSRFDGKSPLRIRQIAHRVDTPQMMGILNITPNSFSDGGKFLDPQKAIIHARNLFDAGADIIDVGAESTNPHATITDPEQEWQRLKTFLYAWQQAWQYKNFCPKLSIDTYKPETVEKLLDYNIDYINDVTGFTNPKMLEVVKQSNAKLIIMHNLGVPANSSVTLPYDIDAIDAVYNWGYKKIDQLIKAGIAPERLIFDVGIGFGKTAAQSLAIIKNITKFNELGVPILVGHSRKSFLQQLTDKNCAKRDIETAGISEYLADKVDYLRVHNVECNMRLLKVRAALT